MSTNDNPDSMTASEAQNIPPSQLAAKPVDEPTSTTPVEMSTLESKRSPETSAAAGSSPAATEDPTSDKGNLPLPSKQAVDSSASAPASGGAGALPSTSSPAPPLLVTRQMSTQIGPSTDSPISMPKEPEREGPTLAITLLLTNGNRHPFKLDATYLQKRNVKVPGDDPFNISIYTLKELILREWRNDWEAKPSSPVAIRLISFGKLLDDKVPLKDCKFNLDAPNVIHMTIKPQEIVDEEDAKGGKGGFGPGSSRDGRERSPGCRCVIL